VNNLYGYTALGGLIRENLPRLLEQPSRGPEGTMCNNDTEPKDSIARDLGWSSYADAPQVVQNNIDAALEGPTVEDPFAMLRRGGD
jgi:hypothetical protein